MARATCPVCKGKGWVPNNAVGSEPVVCHGCDGDGWVDPQEAAAQNETDDPKLLED